MKIAPLTLGLSALVGAVQPNQPSLKHTGNDKRAHAPLRQAGQQHNHRLHRRQDALEPPYTTEGLCDEYDGYFYATPNNYTYQLQCTATYSGGVLQFAVTETFAACLEYCDTFNLLDATPGCVGVNYNAPFVGDGDCYAFDSIDTVLPANEAGGVQEAAVFIRGPDGVTWATPREFLPASTTSTTTVETTSTTTTSVSSSPTLIGGQIFITASQDFGGRMITLYVAFKDGLSILVESREEAAQFVVDDNGYLLSDGDFIASTTYDGTAALQRFATPPPPSPYYWTIEGSSIYLTPTTLFCATLPEAGLGFSVVYDSVPGDGCIEVEIAAELAAGPPLQTASTTTSLTSWASLPSPPTTSSNVSSRISTSPSFTTPTSIIPGGTPTSAGPDTYTGRPDCPLGVVCPELPTHTSSASRQFTMSGNMTTTTIPSTYSMTTTVLPSTGPSAQVTAFRFTAITAFEVQPVLSCNEAAHCTPSPTTRTIVRTRTGVSCFPGTCTGRGIAVNTLVDAQFADPTCFVRP